MQEFLNDFPLNLDIYIEQNPLESLSYPVQNANLRNNVCSY